MMNPDLNDPVWQAEREAQWAQFCADAEDKSEFDMACIRPIFFEAEFDYGNTEKYGKYAKDYRRGFVLCPIQTEERWRKWFLEYLPGWLGDEFESELRGCLVGFGLSPQHRDWSVETSAELFKFCFGERIVFGPYRFLEYVLPRNPLLSSALTFYGRWLNAIVAWLRGSTFNQAGEYNSHLFDMWLSILGLVHPVYFQYEMNMGIVADQKYLQALFVFCRDEYSLEKELIKGEYKSSEIEKTLKDDGGRRVEFLKKFKEAMATEPIPEEMKALWDRSQDPGFVPAGNMEPTIYAPLEDKVHRYTIGKWTDDRLAELEKIYNR